MSKSLTLKDLSPDLLANMARRASDEGRSVQEMVRRLLTQTYGDNPAIVIGWIKLDRWGELDDREDSTGAYATCPECGESIDTAAAYVALLTDGTFSGPFCAACATSQ